jgi:hypothetical protein
VRDWIGRPWPRRIPTGLPKIHAELQELGFTVAERTVARYLRRMVRVVTPVQRWLALLRNHREVIAALDFFTTRFPRSRISGVCRPYQR